MLSFWPNLFLFFAIVALRYVIFAGAAYVLCYRYKRKQWHHRKIAPNFPPREIILLEFKSSILTSLIFALAGALVVEVYKTGGTRLYLDISQYGVWYLLLQIPLLLILHDTYFYWLHRLLHVPALFRTVHRTHHASRTPTPWAAFAFHPIEGVLEAIILPLLVLLIPVHAVVFLFFLMFMTVSSVINHLGYELFPKRFATAPFFRYWITATHHHEHHHSLRSNYGLYFTLWDQIAGTQDPNYEKHFDEVTRRASAATPGSKTV